MDPALSQLHLYVCIMIELKNYAPSPKVQRLFELCKEMLRMKIEDFPLARNVIAQYTMVPRPTDMPVALCKTKYTDKYVHDINDIIEHIFTESESDSDLESAFQKLTNISF
jgi:hypothetical protein